MSANVTHTTDNPDPNDTAGAVASTEVDRRHPRRFRFRIGTLLFVITILALLLVVAIQQVQLKQMRQIFKAQQSKLIAQAAERDKLTTMIREQRDMLERNPGGRGSNERKAARKEP
jgi:cytochrome c-type biogenesis protein CcmH/NrfG